MALSSCEAEYIVVSLCACQATWMVNLVEEIIGKDHGAIIMKIDSMSAINLAKNSIAHGQSKHIEMRFHYLREQVADGKMNLVEEIIGKYHEAITMKIDNMSAINLAKNPISHGRSKHIEMRFHYLREQVVDGEMNVEHCRTENQIADIMMKGVQVEVFRRLRTMMNIDSLDTMN